MSGWLAAKQATLGVVQYEGIEYKIIAKFVKDMSSETPDIDTYLFVKDNLSNYKLNINIQSKALKEKIIQIDTTLKYIDNQESPKKSFFEMIFSTVIRLNDGSIDKTELTKIVLIEVQKEILWANRIKMS